MEKLKLRVNEFNSNERLTIRVYLTTTSKMTRRETKYHHFRLDRFYLKLGIISRTIRYRIKKIAVFKSHKASRLLSVFYSLIIISDDGIR